MENNSHVKIVLREMTVDVRIGLHEHEKGAAQRILINAELFAAPGLYLQTASRETIIDYDRIRNAILQWAERPHTLLIETYLKELVDLCFMDARIEACRVSVAKPDIFKDVKHVGVEVFMRREDWIEN